MLSHLRLMSLLFLSLLKLASQRKALRMPLPLVLKIVHEEITNRLRSAPKLVWIADQPTQADLDHVLKQGSDFSEFDPLQLRKKMLEDLQNKKAILLTRTSKIAKILAVIYPEQESAIPWDLFGKIFTAFGESSKPWRVVWFANPTPRMLPAAAAPPSAPPAAAQAPAAAHMNGGYAYPCEPSTVVVYRWEEAARVLIHELLHAACTDAPEDPIEIKEAKTETWAEIFLAAILSAGKPKKFAQLWKIQAQWIADQEYVLSRDHDVMEPSDYAWRYTLARRFVLKEYGCGLPVPSADPRAAIGGSMRFTSPALG